jgi:peptide/nickel transport system substrate-binding protein
VRRSVALSLDRNALVRGALAGEAEIATQVVGPEVFGFGAALAPIPHAPAQARALLAAAGFAGGFDVTLDLSAPEFADLRVAEALVRDLAAIRISTRLRPQSTRELLARVETRDTSFYLMPWTSSSGDFGITADYLLHTRAEGYGQGNGGGYSSPKLDRLLDAASRTVKPVDRRALLEAAAAQVHKDLPLVPIYRDTDRYALREGLVFKPRLDRQLRALEMRWRVP